MGAIGVSQLGNLLTELRLTAAETGGEIRLRGEEPPNVSPHRLGTIGAVAMAAQGAGIAAVWKLRTGRGQDVRVDIPRAIQALHSMAYTRLNGSADILNVGNHSALHTFNRTKDNRWIFISSYHHQLPPALAVVGCPNEQDAIERKIATWNSFELEEALAARKLPGVVARSREEWLAHPQGQWLAQRPVIEIEKIGDSPVEPLGPAARPLSGLRVLDMAHVLGGPTVSRTLAEQGADVLSLSDPKQQDPPVVMMETGMGKRAAHIDLNDAAQVARVKELARDADMLVQSWRPGGFDRRGLSPRDLAAIRPGIIYVSVSCYGSGGPWMTRGGYDPLGQAASGLSMVEGSVDRPLIPRTQTVNDYMAAYLGAAGALSALVRRAKEGGSYHVKVSLTRCSMWALGFGTQAGYVDSGDRTFVDPVPPVTHTVQSDYGEVTVLAPVTDYSETKAYWELPVRKPNQQELRWR